MSLQAYEFNIEDMQKKKYKLSFYGFLVRQYSINGISIIISTTIFNRVHQTIPKLYFKQ